MMFRSIACLMNAHEKWEEWPSRSRRHFSPSATLDLVCLSNQVSQSTAISLSIHPLLDQQYLIGIKVSVVNQGWYLSSWTHAAPIGLSWCHFSKKILTLENHDWGTVVPLAQMVAITVTFSLLPLCCVFWVLPPVGEITLVFLPQPSGNPLSSNL